MKRFAPLIHWFFCFLILWAPLQLCSLVNFCLNLLQFRLMVTYQLPYTECIQRSQSTAWDPGSVACSILLYMDPLFQMKTVEAAKQIQSLQKMIWWYPKTGSYIYAWNSSASIIMPKFTCAQKGVCKMFTVALLTMVKKKKMRHSSKCLLVRKEINSMYHFYTAFREWIEIYLKRKLSRKHVEKCECTLRAFMDTRTRWPFAVTNGIGENPKRISVLTWRREVKQQC